MALEVDRLTYANLAQCLCLSTEAGWNQTEADWRRLLDLAPQGCSGGFWQGQLVATAALASYGEELAWIGMMLVDRSFRHRGIGTAILTKTLETAKDLGIRTIGLDATDMGRPLYLAAGFEDVCEMARWAGRMPVPASRAGAGPIAAEDLEEVLARDRELSGVDRDPLLRRLRGESLVSGWLIRRHGELRGYAFLRPGREFWHLGPLVAEAAEDFICLLDEAAAALEGQPVFMDSFQTPVTNDLLSGRGMQVQRLLSRMFLGGSRSLLMGPEIRLATSFEWG